VAEAVASGALPVSKAEVLASVVTSRTQEAFVRDQQILLDAASRLAVDEVRKAVRWWQRLADQDGAEPKEPESQLRCTVADDGTTHLAGNLGVEGGAVFRSVLSQIADQLWRARRAGGDDVNETPPVCMAGRLRAGCGPTRWRRWPGGPAPPTPPAPVPARSSR